MDARSRGAPAEHASRVGAAAPPEPPPAYFAVLDRSGVIVAADDRWAAAARDADVTVGALGTVGSRYYDALEAEARRRPELSEPLLRLSEAVRRALAGEGDAEFAFDIGERSHGARIIPVQGAGADHTVITLVDTTALVGSASTRVLEPRLDALLDSIDVGILLQDTEGRALFSNTSARRMLGLTRGQLAGSEPIDPRWALLHEDGGPLPPDERPSRVALRTRRPCRDALIGLKRPDATVTWLSVTAHPVTREGEERPYAVAASIVDVAAARAATQAEQRSHDRFRSLIEHSSDVVTIVDDRGRVTYESPSVEAVLGYAPGELVGSGRIGRVHPDDVDAALSAVTALIGRPGESASCEYRIRARDESWRVLESVATNRLHDPAVLGIVVNTRDVTERRETEAALRATTTRLENLVQNLQAGVLVEDEARRIAVVNRDLCRAFEIDAPPAALLGADCAAACAAAAPLMADPARFVSRIEELIARREPARGEEVAFADGRTFERDYIPISSGRLDRGHLWIYRDITRRKEDEREAGRLRDEAIRASRLKSEFLATMSHEVRTPMHGVLATVELLLDTPLEPHQRDLAGLIRDASHGLLSVVNDALDLSKIEAEKLEARDVELDLTGVVEGVADVVLSAARRKGLALTVYVDPRIPSRLRGDPQWLRQVLVNLAGNAVKFTDRGEVAIRAELEAELGSRAAVRLAVTDTGPGIPAADRDRLFEPFVQLGTQRRGTGLGLAICQRLVGLMGGELEVEGEDGRGSKFSFSLTLPVFERAAREPRSDLRVLVAVPHREIAAIAAAYLGARGMETDWADSAPAAMELSRERRFDVAIVGIAGPDRAAELAAALRSAPGGEEMRMVLLKDVDAPPGPEGAFACELTRPLKQAPLYEAVTGRPASGPDDRESAPTLRDGLRVLVAEDNEVNRELLVRQLAKLGVAADAVASGHEAVDAVLAGPYDAVLLDVHMPEVDGPRAARAIRAIPSERGAVPIIAVTGAGTPDERGACLAAGMSEFLQKPVASGDLARALERALSGPPADVARPPAIDRDAIERLDADLGDRAEIRRIAGIFISQIEHGTRSIAAAADARDSEALRRSAHRLASASATFGAARVADLCSRMEALGAAGRADASTDLARELEAEAPRAAADLRTLLELAPYKRPGSSVSSR
jgi:PAS domain S-box-containing protein